MTSLHVHRISLTAAVAFAVLLLGAAALDRDMLLAIPLALLFAVLFGGAVILAGRRDRWPVFAILGGAVGWIGSIAVLMNLEI